MSKIDENIISTSTPISIIIVLIFLCPVMLYSAIDGDRAHLLSLPASAAGLGRGIISSSGAMDASDIYRFPVNSAFAGGAQIIVGHTWHEGGAKTTYSAAALPMFYSGTVGFFIRNVSIPTFSSNTYGLSFAHYNREYLYGVGGHLAFTESGIFGETDDFASIGLDFRVDPLNTLSGRVYYLHSGLPLHSDVAGDLTDQFGLIVNYHPLRADMDYWDIDFGAGMQKTGSDIFALGASAELSAGRRYFARIGYEHAFENSSTVSMTNGKRPSEISFSGISAGLGFVAARFGADVAYKFNIDDKDGIWATNVKYEIESFKKRNAADNFALAQEYFEKNRFKKSLRYSERALAVDSTHWNAKTLRQKSEAELRRINGNDIAIIYGGNGNGAVIPYPPSIDAIGGLSRYAATVKSLRIYNRVNFTIDVGNILSANNNKLTVELASNYYNLMNFDLIASGEGEVAYGPFEFMAAQKRAIPVVITNLNDNNMEQSGIASSILLTNDDYNIYVINLIAKSVLANDVKHDMTINIGSIKGLLRSQRATNANLRVAVIHGNLNDIRRLASEFQELNVIIAGSLNQKLETPIIVGRTLIVSAGSENKYAGCLTVNFDNAKHRKGQYTVKNTLYPIYQEIAPDSAIENITKLVSASIEVIDGGGSKTQTRVSGIIPHLSDRGNGAMAFIKAVGSKSEFNISDNMSYSRNPSFSSLSNRAAFVYGSNGTSGQLRMTDLATMTGRTVSSPEKNIIEAVFSPSENFLYYIEADSSGNKGAIYKTRMYMYDAIPVLYSDGLARRDLSISNDGTTLLFCARGSDNRWSVYALDSSAIAAPTRLTSGGADYRYPRQSFNGQYIAYLSDRKGFGGQMDLWIFERGKNGAIHKQITTKANVREFTWSDDSETIYFSSGANLFEINSVNIKDMNIHKMITLKENAVKTWSENTPRFIIHSGAPKIVYTREYINGVRRIHWYDILEKKDEKVYTVGEFNEWLD